MREHRDVVVTLNPCLSELEVVAFLQAKWETLEDKSKYEQEPKPSATEPETQESSTISQRRKDKAKEKNIQRKKITAGKTPKGQITTSVKDDSGKQNAIFSLDEICQKKKNKGRPASRKQPPAKVIELSSQEKDSSKLD